MRHWVKRDRSATRTPGVYYEDISTGSSFAAIFMDGEELPVRMSYFCDKQHCETKTMEFETVEAAKLAAEMLV